MINHTKSLDRLSQAQCFKNETNLSNSSNNNNNKIQKASESTKCSTINLKRPELLMKIVNEEASLRQKSTNPAINWMKTSVSKAGTAIISGLARRCSILSSKTVEEVRNMKLHEMTKILTKDDMLWKDFQQSLKKHNITTGLDTREYLCSYIIEKVKDNAESTSISTEETRSLSESSNSSFSQFRSFQSEDDFSEASAYFQRVKSDILLRSSASDNNRNNPSTARKTTSQSRLCQNLSRNQSLIRPHTAHKQIEPDSNKNETWSAKSNLGTKEHSLGLGDHALSFVSFASSLEGSEENSAFPFPSQKPQSNIPALTSSSLLYPRPIMDDNKTVPIQFYNSISKRSNRGLRVPRNSVEDCSILKIKFIRFSKWLTFAKTSGQGSVKIAKGMLLN